MTKIRQNKTKSDLSREDMYASQFMVHQVLLLLYLLLTKEILI